MHFSLPTVARLALALLLSATGLTTAAQSISLSTTCINEPWGSTSTTTATFSAPAGISLIGTNPWSVIGDLVIVSTSGNTCVVRSTGYGKGVVEAKYTAAGCTTPITASVRSAGIFKNFTTWPGQNQIVGPTCLPASGDVTYSINSIVTQESQIQAGIGTDTYQWTVTPLVTFTYKSGDKSSITFTPASGTSYVIKVRVGQCNFGNAAAEKVLNATAGSTPPAVTGFPTCLATNAPLTNTFTFTLPVKTGVVYDVQVPPSWSRTNPTYPAYPFTATADANLLFTVNADQNGGNVIIKSTPVCGGAVTQVLPVNRRLVFSGLVPQPVGTQSLTNPGCFATSNATSINMTLTNAPANTLLRWTLPTSPSGWNITTAGASKVDAVNNVWLAPATVAIAVPAGHSGGTVRVNADGCPSLTGPPSQEVTRILAITGQGSCTYTILRTAGTNDQGFSLNSSSGGPGTACLPSSNPAQQVSVLYTWRAPKDPAYQDPLDPGDTVMVKTSISAVVSFDYPVLPSSKIRVSISQTSGGCLSVPKVFQVVARPNPGPGPGPSPSTPLPAAQRAALMRALECYPNPADGLVRIGLPAVAAEGATRLTLVNALGQVQRTLTVSKATTATLDVRELPADTYILRVELPNGQATGRALQVQH